MSRSDFANSPLTARITLGKPNANINIIIPTFNVRDDLPGCIQSIRDSLGTLLGEQVFVTIQDGQSTDGTVSYLQQLDAPGISYRCEKDSGIYDAMNRAVASSDCRWVYFLGADDRLMDGFANAIPRLTDQNAVYYGDVRLVSSGARYDGSFNRVKLVYRNICHQAMFFPTAILKRSPFNPDYVTHADWAKNIELMADHEYIYLDECIATFRDREGSSGNIFDRKFARDKASLFRKHHGIPLMILSKTALLPTKLYHLATGRLFFLRR